MPNQHHQVPRATQILPALRDADITHTTVQPLHTLRHPSRATARGLPDSAMDLPLWRPGTEKTPAPAPEVPAEQTAIEHVAAHIVGHVYRSRTAQACSALREEMDDLCQTEAVAREELSRAALEDVTTALAELDAHAESAGFLAAVARNLGRRLAFHEITPWDALAELQALH